MIRAASLLTLALAQPAGAFELAWPAACVLGDTCHIQQYFDHDAGPDATDFSCGPLSYDGHDGTDIALIDRAEMAEGVAILAAAPGVVRGMRDGIADFVPKVEGKECGNGVVITHADGWETQYCHMRQGSVVVRPGQQVQTGDKLGLIGQSGMADFPHVHLSVRHNGKKIDPFEPEGGTCRLTEGPTLWAQPEPYEPGGFLAAGFSTAVPTLAAIRAGLPTEPLPDTAAGLVLWAFAFGTRAGDEMTFRIDGPQGQVLQEQASLEITQAQMFQAMGKRLTAAAWPDGVYDGVVDLIRAGVKVDQIKVTVQVGP
ncbi:MAG: M23 family metallopeptidase [bacterium]